MADPFENYSTVLRMRQSRLQREDLPYSIENKEVMELKPTESMITYESVDNYPAIVRIREGREPINSFGNCQFFDSPIVRDNTMVTGGREGAQAPAPYYTEDDSQTQSEAEASETTRSDTNTELSTESNSIISGRRERVKVSVPYYTEDDSQTQSEAEASEATGSESNTESSTGSTVESLPVLMVPPGKIQPNLMIPSAMSLEDEKKPKYAVEDPIHEIAITESNILESFSMQSASRRSRDSRDSFDGDNEKETEATRTSEDNSTLKKASSPLEESIMDMDAYYKSVTERPVVSPLNSRVEEMKKIMLTFWKQDQSAATVLFTVSWQLSRRYRSIGEFSAHPERNKDETEQGLIGLQLLPVPSGDLLLWRLFQRFCANQGQIVIPKFLCSCAVEELTNFDWSKEIEAMESDEISDSDPVMNGILTVDQVLNLEDNDDDEIFKFRKFISDEYRKEQEHSEDEQPSLSEDEDIFKFQGRVDENHYVFESEPSVANSGMASSQVLAPMATYEPFSRLEKIVEEVGSNGETESTATSAANADQVDEPRVKAVEDDTSRNESLDDIIMIDTKSGVHADAISVDGSESNVNSLAYSEEDNENCGHWGNAYCSSMGKSKLDFMPIEAAFDVAIRGIRSIETECSSARGGSRRGARECSIRSRGDYSLTSEQTTFPEDCLPENLVDNFLETLEIALCLR